MLVQSETMSSTRRRYGALLPVVCHFQSQLFPDSDQITWQDLMYSLEFNRGPLVYGIAYCPVNYQDQMKTIGFADSKALTAQARDDLLHALIEDSKNIEICRVKAAKSAADHQAILKRSHSAREVLAWVLISPASSPSASDSLFSSGWAVRVLSPQSISSGMLRRRPVNLNLQSSNATILLISTILESGIDLTEIYVDTVGDASSYAKLLSSNFPKHKHIKWTVTSKADSIYPIVGAASITAKVTRDHWMENWLFTEQNFGRVEKVVDQEDTEMAKTTKRQANEKARGKRKLKEITDSGDERDVETSQTTVSEGNSQAMSLSQSESQLNHPEEKTWILGSGYPGDPKTIQFLKDSIDPIFGYPGLVRFSWSTIKVTLGIPDSSDKSSSSGSAKFKSSSKASDNASSIKTKYNALKVRWMDEPTPISNFFGGAGKAKNASSISVPISERERMREIWKQENEESKSSRTALWRDMGLNNVGPGSFGF